MDETEIGFIRNLLKEHGKISLDDFGEFYNKRFKFYPDPTVLSYLKIENDFVTGLDLEISQEESEKRLKKFKKLGY